MKWLMVGKTVVPFDPDEKVKPQFVLINEGASDPVVLCPTLENLAWAIINTKVARNDQEVRCIKNDLPAIVWRPDGCKASPDTVLECERLDKQTLHELLLRLKR